MPMERIASATVRPCAVSPSTGRSLATISSAVCRFLDIDPSSTWPKAICGTAPRTRALSNGAPPENGAVICSAFERGHRPPALMKSAM